MKHIGKQQLLMLLLVVASKHNQLEPWFGQIVECLRYCRVDMGAVSADFIERWPSEQPAQWPSNAVALGLVIAGDFIDGKNGELSGNPWVFFLS